MSTEHEFLISALKTANFRIQIASTDIEWGLGLTKTIYCRTLCLHWGQKNDEKNSLGTLINKNHNREKNLNCFFNFLHIFFRIFSGNSIFQKNIKKLIFSGNSIFRRELFPFFFRRRAFISIWNTSMGTRGPSKWM